MADTKDYRNSEYCPKLSKVDEEKKTLELLIQKESPKTQIIYNKVRNRKEKYNSMFAGIYNYKCGYCGCLCGLLPLESFEVDHFINEASFPKTTAGRIEAGRMTNLVWSCITCNRGKTNVTVAGSYINLLNPDLNNITSVFERNHEYYIKITDAYKEDGFINEFYEKLCLGYERRRIDYMLLELEGMYEEEKDPDKKAQLGESLLRLTQKRNRASIYEKKIS